jgi:hypothetical protein
MFTVNEFTHFYKYQHPEIKVKMLIASEKPYPFNKANSMYVLEHEMGKIEISVNQSATFDKLDDDDIKSGSFGEITKEEFITAVHKNVTFILESAVQ